jgi:hypothetical protein
MEIMLKSLLSFLILVLAIVVGYQIGQNYNKRQK